jgi:hypothetical protein
MGFAVHFDITEDFDRLEAARDKTAAHVPTTEHALIRLLTVSLPRGYINGGCVDLAAHFARWPTGGYPTAEPRIYVREFAASRADWMQVLQRVMQDPDVTTLAKSFAWRVHARVQAIDRGFSGRLIERSATSALQFLTVLALDCALMRLL